MASKGLRSRGGFNVEMHLVGEWAKLNSLVNNLDTTISVASTNAQLKLANKYKDRVKLNIRTGGKRFGYPKNKEDYSNFKKKKGGPNSLLVWSRAMHDNVEVVKLRGNRYGVGIPKNIKRASYHRYDNNRLSVSEYANVLEHGTSKIKPRPVFSDTFRYDIGGIKGLKTYIEWHLRREFIKRGINLTKI